MAKSKTGTGMHKNADRKTRGRQTISTEGPSPTTPHVPQTQRREATRPVTAGGGKHRGDRRDTSKTYTGNEKHASRGSNPRIDVKTRKR